MSVTQLSRTNFFLFSVCTLLMISIYGCKKNESLTTGQNTVNKDAGSRQTQGLVESSDFTIMDNNTDLVYLGNVLSGKLLTDSAQFRGLSGFQKLPIRITCSFPGTNTGDVINTPRMSSFRQTLQNILRRNSFQNTQIGAFAYTYRPFYDYDELRKDFGYNLSVRGLFSSSSTSLMHNVTTIKKKFGFVASFEIENFTVDMPLPKKTELIGETDLVTLIATGKDPLYINSISYGQKGILSVETNLNMEETNKAFTKVTSNIFKKTTEILTEYEKHLIQESTITLFLVGGPNSGSPMAIDGYNSFITYVTSLGDFSADNPGYPISFRMRKLQDYSLFKLSINMPN
ncbi:thiol-activated cytolysin family protein [Pedobacter cryoconitis]|uniref:Thiol-activated cytolysin n=1 Tax=Pedobacter cryoconitis TaxID=188932 RepID=A0A327SAW3_9SPHI|nr:thiol-activated cytolysin family protein [Pedobacter cryoconitis]RAJ26071.1 thiol-activated cytolysin [Pedobacter cryoconitis]